MLHFYFIEKPVEVFRMRTRRDVSVGLTDSLVIVYSLENSHIHFRTLERLVSRITARFCDDSGNVQGLQRKACRILQEQRYELVCTFKDQEVDGNPGG